MDSLAKVFGWIAATIAGVLFVGLILLVVAWGLGSPPPDVDTVTPVSPLGAAIWPAPRDATATISPRDVARSFVEEFVGLENPALGPLATGDVVPVFGRGADGRRTDTVVATIFLKRLAGRWFVAAALSDEIEMSAPDLDAVISTPVRIAGSGVGRGSRVAVRVHAAFEPRALARRSVNAGTTRAARFSASLTFAPLLHGRGVIVVRARGGRSGSKSFEAYPVSFGTG